MTFAVHIYLMIGLRVKYTVMLSVSETSFGMVVFCLYKTVLAKLLFFKSFASTTFVIFGCLRRGSLPAVCGLSKRRFSLKRIA